MIDGEPLYEDHPLAFRSRDYGYSFDAHVRQRAYWDVFSGAAGHTYGNHSVWQMYAPARKPVNGPLFYWNEAIHRPGATQMQYVRALVESRPYLSRVPDQSLVANALEGADHIVATRGDGYAFVYSAAGTQVHRAPGQARRGQGESVVVQPAQRRSTDAGAVRHRRLRTSSPAHPKDSAAIGSWCSTTRRAELPRRQASLHVLRRLALRPRVVLRSKTHPLADGRVRVQPELDERARRRIRQPDLAHDLERLAAACCEFGTIPWITSRP